jgi:hypothetical protein
MAGIVTAQLEYSVAQPHNSVLMQCQGLLLCCETTCLEADSLQGQMHRTTTSLHLPTGGAAASSHAPSWLEGSGTRCSALRPPGHVLVRLGRATRFCKRTPRILMSSVRQV